MTSAQPFQSVSDFYALPRAVIGKVRRREANRILEGASRPAPQWPSEGLYLPALISYLEERAALPTLPDDCAELENSLVEELGGGWQVLHPGAELPDALDPTRLTEDDLGAFYKQRLGRDEDAGREMLAAADCLRAALEQTPVNHVLVFRSRPGTT